MYRDAYPSIARFFSILVIANSSYTPNPPLHKSVQVGLYCGITQGLFFDRFGGRRAGLLATLLLCIGYFGTFIVSLARVSSVAPLCIFFFCIGQGSHGLYTLATVTNMFNFAGPHQGTVMGMLAGAFGLGGALFAGMERMTDPAADPTDITGVSSANRSHSHGVGAGRDGGGGRNANADAVGLDTCVMLGSGIGQTGTMNVTHPLSTAVHAFDLNSSLSNNSVLFNAASATLLTHNGSLVHTHTHEPMFFFLVAGLIMLVVGCLGAWLLRHDDTIVRWRPLQLVDVDGREQVEKWDKRDATLFEEEERERRPQEMYEMRARQAEGGQAIPILEASDFPSQRETSLMDSEAPSGPEGDDDRQHLFHAESTEVEHVDRDQRVLIESEGELDITGLALLRKLDFWLLFCALAIDDG